MTIKEVETRTGLERANIRFYEKEGLLSPARSENGYRDYAEDDVQVLLRIKLLRQVRLTLEEIKSLQSGALELTDALQAQIAALEREQQAAEGAQTLCRRMMDDRATFQALDAEKYLQGLMPGTANETFTAVDMEPQAFCPWRRYLARMLDLTLYRILFQAAFCLSTGFPSHRLGTIIPTLAAMGLMLVVEPLLLHRFGTTFGKFCFGLSIESADGGRLSYKDAFTRTAGVLGYGMAVQIPFLDLYTLWKSYKRCKNHQCQPWEEASPIHYSFRNSDFVCAVRTVAAGALILGLAAVIVIAQRTPPNRGDLTVAEFAENVNYFRAYFFEDAQYELDDAGQWAPFPSNSYTVSITSRTMPKLTYTTNGETVTGVSFSIERSGESIVFLPREEMALLTMGLLGASEEAGIFSDAPSKLGNHILNAHYAYQPRNEFTIEQYGVTVNWTLQQHGYEIISDMLVENGITSADDRSYRLTFSAELQ